MRARSLVTIALACVASSVADAGTPVLCAPEPGGVHTAVRAIDGETILLDDGQEVRLVGALAPKPETLHVKAQEWPPAREAKRALAELVEGRTIELRHGSRRHDRYGRLLAQVLARTPDGAAWVQERLIASGHARASTAPEDEACLPLLMQAEASARTGRLGLWQYAIFAVREADDTRAILRLSGSFALVEGRVAAVAHRDRESFINFGSDWRRDFTASVPGKIVEKTPGARQRLDALAGKRIRVRGWIERRNGPMIRLGSLGEIEDLDQSPP